MPPNVGAAFATRLKLARKQRGRPTAAALARELGIEDETYRSYERGDREPDLATLYKISVHLDISLDFLIRGDIPSFNKNQH